MTFSTLRAVLAATALSIALPAITATEAWSASPTKPIAGSASWYGKKFHGGKTASGERFDMNGLTAAHRTLPFGTKVKITNRSNGKSVVVRINDRGPRPKHRVIDLSRRAAQEVGMITSGTAPVTVEVLPK